MSYVTLYEYLNKLYDKSLPCRRPFVRNTVQHVCTFFIDLKTPKGLKRFMFILRTPLPSPPLRQHSVTENPVDNLYAMMMSQCEFVSAVLLSRQMCPSGCLSLSVCCKYLRECISWWWWWWTSSVNTDNVYVLFARQICVDVQIDASTFA